MVFSDVESFALRLRWSIQALAQEADVQQALFPGFVCVADELALDFDDALRGLMGRWKEVGFEALELSLLGALDDRLSSMSAARNESLWTDEALTAAQEWADLRALARSTLEKLGWPTAAPPVERGAVYVGPPGWTPVTDDA